MMLLKSTAILLFLVTYTNAQFGLLYGKQLNNITEFLASINKTSGGTGGGCCPETNLLLNNIKNNTAILPNIASDTQNLPSILSNTVSVASTSANILNAIVNVLNPAVAEISNLINNIKDALTSITNIAYRIIFDVSFRTEPNNVYMTSEVANTNFIFALPTSGNLESIALTLPTVENRLNCKKMRVVGLSFIPVTNIEILFTYISINGLNSLLPCISPTAIVDTTGNVITYNNSALYSFNVLDYPESASPKRYFIPYDSHYTACIRSCETIKISVLKNDGTLMDNSEISSVEVYVELI